MGKSSDLICDVTGTFGMKSVKSINYACTQFCSRWPLNMNLSNNFLWTPTTFTERNSSNDCRDFTVRAIVLNWHLGLLSLSFSTPLEFPSILLLSSCIYLKSGTQSFENLHPDGMGDPVVCSRPLIGWFCPCTVRHPPVLHTDERVFGHRKSCLPFVCM